MTAWTAYKPDQQHPWDSRRVAHLHRRTVFGLTAGELRRDLNSTPDDCVSRLLAGECREGVPKEFERLSALIGEAAAGQKNIDRLKAWWIYRMLFSPDPLGERLTFMWHNHFATSNLKVNDLTQMKRQNDTFRASARAKFGPLLHAMLRDPALLRWLDAQNNRKGKANENLGRELLELFTLGIGNFNEADVKGAARALTGLAIKGGQFRFDKQRHDSDEKTILGQTRNLDPERLVDLLLSHPATARRLADKLIAEFFAADVVSDKERDELALRLTESSLDIGKAVETILRSQLFFSDANINRRISDPLTFLIAPLRALEVFEPPSTLILVDWLRRMGLELFYPPNVAGWPGGRAWLTTRTVIARANYGAAVLSGEIHRDPKAPSLEQLARKHDATKPDEFRSLMNTLLFGSGDRESEKEESGSDYLAVALKVMTGTSVHLH